MSVKTAWMFLAAGCLALSVQAAENAPAAASVGKAEVYQAEKYSLAQNAIVYNAKNRYRFIVVQSKPAGEKPPRTQFWLSCGEMGFSPLVNFLKITVNGISNAKITPKAEDIVRWQENGLAGCEAKFNFDGAKVILRLYMRSDSPVLWASLRPAPDSLEEIRSARVTISAVISNLVKENKKAVWDNVYEREAVTPDRIIPQGPKSAELSPKDTFLVLQDRKFDGSAEDKGQGPVMVLLDYEGVSKASLLLRNKWNTDVVIDLKPDFTEFRFGLWQQKPRISNADFAKKLQEEKAAFTR